MLTKESEYIEILGILCHRKSESKKTYKLLSPNKWTRDICEEINKASFNTKFELEDKTKLRDITERSHLKSIFNQVEKIKGVNKINKLYLYDELPDGIEYVRFFGTVILKEENTDIAKKCLSSIISNLDMVVKFDSVKQDLLDNHTEPIRSFDKVKKQLQDLKDICALSAKFSINKRYGSDNYIWYELLQNANDHIPPNSSKKMTISIENNILKLKYPDRGFSVRDFLAICTNGNSANVLFDEDREGKKGTGFKSVYNLFDKVVITSGPVKCILSDQPAEVSFEKGNKSESTKIEVSYKNDAVWKDEKWNYPIPVFEEYTAFEENSTHNIVETCIELYLRADKEISTIYRMIFGETASVDSAIEDLVKDFEENKAFLFLDRIDSFIFESYYDKKQILDKSEYIFNKSKYISDNFELVEENLNLNDDNLENNFYWYKRKNTDTYEGKRKVSILMPLGDKIDDAAKALYCTLPIKEFKMEIPFYMNIPLLELTDDRTNVSNQDGDNGDLKKWNALLFESVVEVAIQKIFTKLANNKEDDTKINRTNLYKYYPYKYLDDNKRIFNDKRWLGIKDIPFIRVKAGNDFKTYSLNKCAVLPVIDNKEDGKFVFLPDYMYWWFEKKNGLDEFISDIPFVYYDKIESNRTSDQILEKIEENYSNFNTENAIFYFNKSEVNQVGKVANEIWHYIRKKCVTEKKEKTTGLKDDIFCQWLKEIRKSAEFIFANRDQLIFNSFLSYCFNINNNDKYHCLGNSNLQLINEEVSNQVEIEGYINIYGFVQEVGLFFKDEAEWFNIKEINDIKSCFNELLESPYIKYKRYWKDGQQDVESHLRVEPITENINQELLCEYTERLFETEKLDDERIREWIEQGNVLYLKNNNQPIALTPSIYFSSQSIQHENIIYLPENLEKVKSFLKNLDREVKCKQFYIDSDKELIHKVINTYNKIEWSTGVKSYLYEEENIGGNKGKFILLFKSYIQQINESLSWRDKFSVILKELVQEDFRTEINKPIFKFESDDIKSINQIIKEKFKAKVSYKQISKIVNDQINQLGSEKISLEQFVEERVFVLDYNTGNKLLYCWGVDENNQNIIVLFGENAFGKMLREVFDCNEYSVNRKYIDMTSMELDSLFGFNAIHLSEIQKEKIQQRAAKIVEQWENEWNREWLKDILIERWDIFYEEGNKIKWINAQGYGAKDFEDKKCPICGAVLLSERSLLNIGYVSCRIEDSKEKNIHLPMLMCDNCYKSLSYAEQVYLKFDGKDDLNTKLCLDETKKAKLPIVFRMYAMEEKEIQVEITFLNRWLWYKLIAG